MLRASVTGTQPLPGDAQSCEFVTATFPATIVSVRPGVGRTTLEAWTTGKMPIDSGPLPGISDSAVWLGARTIGRPITTATDVYALGLLPSGLAPWIPSFTARRSRDCRL